MRYLLSLFLAFSVCMIAWSGNFVIQHGESLKLYAPRVSDSYTERADRLFSQDCQELFGEFVVHTNRPEEAKIIVGNYDSPDIRKFAKIRGVSFESLSGRSESFILKVHNNGTQLFVIGSDDKGTAFGLMTLSRIWGVSPFRWWSDVPAIPQPEFELDVAFEKLYEPSVPKRMLILSGAQRHDNYLQDMLLRLRASDVMIAEPQVSDAADTFTWNLNAAQQPYLGLNLTLDHPERMRLEALRAYDHGQRSQWQVRWGRQLGGELQVFLFFDMAWDLPSYRDEYAVDNLIDLHFNQMCGFSNNWSKIWNDYFDLAMLFHPEEVMNLESLRRGIGESQSLGLQLSMDLSDKAIPDAYTNAFFRTVEYPINMLSAQMQRLCNMQLVKHNLGKSWAIDDCKQRMELLAMELPKLILPKWRQIMGANPMPDIELNHSLMRVDNGKLSDLKVGDSSPLPPDGKKALVFRSPRAIGTQVVPFEAFRVPVNYEDKELHLCVSLLPVKLIGKSITCMVSVDRGPAQLIQLSPDAFPASQQIYKLHFAVDQNVFEHEIVFRTMSDGIYLQRVWLDDIKNDK